jgi:hypothetical protein
MPYLCSISTVMLLKTVLMVMVTKILVIDMMASVMTGYAVSVEYGQGVCDGCASDCAVSVRYYPNGGGGDVNDGCLMFFYVEDDHGGGL